MTINRKSVLAAFIAPVLAAGTAHAVELGPYIGASVGQTTAKAKTNLTGLNTFHFDKQETGYKLYGGFNFLPWLGVEGGYVDFGSPEDSENIAGLGGIKGKADLTGWQAFAVGTLPLGPVDVFVKMGGIAANFDLKISGSALPTNFNDSDSNSMFAYGAGVAYSFGKLAVRVEAEGYDVDTLDDLYLISAGLTYHL